MFESWIATGTARFVAAGLSESRAREIAILLIASLEGAFILCRASRNTEPMAIAREATVEALRSALAEAG